jgi:hypothetical protein
MVFETMMVYVLTCEMIIQWSINIHYLIGECMKYEKED